jgi:hypothetical protein
MADNLPPSSADVTESGSLNLPEPSGPHRHVMGLLYLTLPFNFVLILNYRFQTNDDQTTDAYTEYHEHYFDDTLDLSSLNPYTRYLAQTANY